MQINNLKMNIYAVKGHFIASLVLKINKIEVSGYRLGFRTKGTKKRPPEGGLFNLTMITL